MSNTIDNVAFGHRYHAGRDCVAKTNSKTKGTPRTTSPMRSATHGNKRYDATSGPRMHPSTFERTRRQLARDRPTHNYQSGAESDNRAQRTMGKCLKARQHRST